MRAEWSHLTVWGGEVRGMAALEVTGGVGVSRGKQEPGSTRSTREPSWWVRRGQPACGTLSKGRATGISCAAHDG